MEVFKLASGKFSVELYKRLNQAQNENLIFSPISIQTCISLALLGASGATAEEIKSALQFSKLTMEQLKEALERFTKDLKTETGLSMGTLMAISQGHELKSSFNETAKKCLDLVAENMDFSDNVEAAKQINDWIAQKTANIIRDAINSDSIDRTLSMILVNAVYFKATWVDQFDPEDNMIGKFYLNETDVIDIEYMIQVEHYKYEEFPEFNCRVIELPYENSNASFLIFLPDTKTGLTQIEEKISDININEIIGKLRKYKVRLHLPKFKIESKFDLNESLKSLGISKAFSDQAEFNEMLEKSSGNMKINNVVHKTFIEVNEKGTEAGGVTEMRVNLVRRPKNFYVDRPFLFVLQCNGFYIFIGRCCNPNPESRIYTCDVQDTDHEEEISWSELLEDMNKEK